ncbi:MAG: polymer-forming cytoskeletal protein [Rectinema sp.]
MTDVQVSVVDEEMIDTVLGADVRFSGKIKSSKSFMIKGRVSGSVEIGAELFIAEGADVEADLDALQVTVRGRVKGRIRAGRSIQVLPGATVSGDLQAPEIAIEHGSHFDGTCTITGDDANAV